MKSILYIGATLMIGACIYGFVDYKSTNRTKEFKSLYRNKAVTPKPSPAPGQVAEVKTIEKVNEHPIPGEISGKPAIQAVEKKPARTKRKVTRNKELNFKKYSRAALEAEEVVVPKQKK